MLADFFYNAVFGLVARAVFSLLQKAVVSLFSVLFNIFAAGVLLHVFVGKLGELFRRDFIELYCENRVLAAKIVRLIIFGELNGNISAFAKLHTFDLSFESGNKASAAQNKVVAFRSAAGKFFAVYRTREIDVYGIAVCAGSVRNFDVGCVFAEKLFNLPVNVRFRNIILILFDF